MQPAEIPTTSPDANPTVSRTVLELTVRNHPGVMSHVCGLFSRRAFNLEAILCLPHPAGETSRLWLLVNEDERLEQVLKQTAKLHDVIRVSRCADKGLFKRLAEMV